MADRSDIMRKVRALIDKADSTTFDEERDAFIAKADALMASYAIEEFELQFAKPVTEREKPEVRTFAFNDVEDWELQQILVHIFASLARHCGCMFGTYTYSEARTVGFKSDLDWLDWLYTSIRLHMTSTMAPKPNKDLTIEENVVLLKETGLKWQGVYEKLLPMFYGHAKFESRSEADDGKRSSWMWKQLPNGRWYPKDVPRPIGVWFTGVYTKYCKEHNLPRTYASPEVYRRSFIEGYTTRLLNRIAEMGRNRETALHGKELMLANKDGDLKEFLYDMFPDKRPHPATCECAKCKPTYKPVRGSRSMRYQAPKLDYGAMANGRRAAEGADLLGGRNNLGGKKGELR